MNLSKYETLAVVMEQHSLTAAARELGCTQSAVSHCIDSLEKELGFPVLKRGRAGVRENYCKTGTFNRVDRRKGTL